MSKVRQKLAIVCALFVFGTLCVTNRTKAEAVKALNIDTKSGVVPGITLAQFKEIAIKNGLYGHLKPAEVGDGIGTKAMIADVEIDLFDCPWNPRFLFMTDEQGDARLSSISGQMTRDPQTFKQWVTKAIGMYGTAKCYPDSSGWDTGSAILMMLKTDEKDSFPVVLTDKHLGELFAKRVNENKTPSSDTSDNSENKQKHDAESSINPGISEEQFMAILIAQSPEVRRVRALQKSGQTLNPRAVQRVLSGQSLNSLIVDGLPAELGDSSLKLRRTDNLCGCPWIPNYEFAKDENGISRLVCIRGLLGADQLDAVKAGATRMWGHPTDQKTSLIWDAGTSVLVIFPPASSGIRGYIRASLIDKKLGMLCNKRHKTTY